MHVKWQIILLNLVFLYCSTTLALGYVYGYNNHYLFKEYRMKYHRLNEIIALLQPEWQKTPDTNLLQLLDVLAKEIKFEGALAELSDDALIYHLKMRNSDKGDMIPGLAKDQEDDFKTALLKARGFV